MRFSISSSDDNDDSSKKKSDHELKIAIPAETENYAEIENSLSYEFKDQKLLERAFTHRSVGAEGRASDYERLEFLGDAVLDLAVAHLLLLCYPDAKEGVLSKMRAALVNTISLAEIARSINFGKFIRLSRGEMANGGADRPSILADVFEAVMGAIYKESGYGAAFKSIESLFDEPVKTVNPTDPKTELQEALHTVGCSSPTYLLECVEGPEHAPTFISVVEIDQQIAGRGKGNTKKASQQNAASEALKLLRKDDEIDSNIINGASDKG